jgi:hypothetical protein
MLAFDEFCQNATNRALREHVANEMLREAMGHPLAQLVGRRHTRNVEATLPGTHIIVRPEDVRDLTFVRLVLTIACEMKDVPVERKMFSEVGVTTATIVLPEGGEFHIAAVQAPGKEVAPITFRTKPPKGV